MKKEDKAVDKILNVIIGSNRYCSTCKSTKASEHFTEGLSTCNRCRDKKKVRSITLDFNSIKDGDKIHSFLVKQAENEMRTVEGLIFYLLKGFM